MAGALPDSLTALRRLESLLTEGTDLCAPANRKFQEWLEGVPRHRIPTCEREEVPVYLVQAVQSLAYPVPLVEDERALLRVFVTARDAGDTRIPPVRATFYQDGEVVHVADIAGKTATIPKAIDEGDLDLSSNAEIPDTVVRDGLEMVVEVDPDSTLDPDLGVTKRIPETGRMSVTVREVPTLELTLIPFVNEDDQDSSIVDTVKSMAGKPGTHELLGPTRTLLPVRDLDVTAHAPVLTNDSTAFGMFSEVVAIRAMEGGTGHYLGMATKVEGGVVGVAFRPGWSAFSVTKAHTIAHELGHNVALFHAPCGRPSGVDPAFPGSDGSIGAWGYDFESGKLVPPTRSDLMSYCAPQWISDYHFSNAFRFRRNPVGLDPDPSPSRSLLVWGGTDSSGAPFMEPAFVVNAPRTLPPEAGDYVITGHDAAGLDLFSIRFDMLEVADGDGRSAFAFTVPLDDGWGNRLVRITLSGQAGSFELDEDTNRAMAILRDPGDGQVRGILRGVSAQNLAGTGLDVHFSRGIPDPPN